MAEMSGGGIGSADTSIYKMPMPVSPLDVAAKFANTRSAIQGNISNDLSINQQKLDQANQGLQYLTRAMTALGPNASKDAYKAVGDETAKVFNLPPAMVQIWHDKVDAAPTTQDFYKEAMSAGADHAQRLALGTGVNATQTDNAVNYQGKFDLMKGGFTPATQNPVQLAPTQPTAVTKQTIPNPNFNPNQPIDSDNNPTIPNPNYMAPGVIGPAGPAGFTSSRPGGLPVEPLNNAQASPAAVPMPQSRPSLPTTGPTGHDFNQRFAGEPTIIGAPPTYAPGLASHNADQLVSSARSQAIKPAIQAYKLMPGLSTGPGTEQITDLVAAAKALGLVDIEPDSDPTVLRQEINKKLAQYVGGSPIANRSDASQALAEAGSPSAKVQILPALMNLTRDTIALDRVKILQPQAFKGNDYQNYIKHQGTFPGRIDEKALSIDLLPEKERDSLVKKMVSQYKNGNADEKAKANKFLETLKLVSEHKDALGMQ